MANTTYTTADGKTFAEGDTIFDYYSMELIVVGRPAGSDGWFITNSAANPAVRSRSGMLNGERVCSLAHARRMGWLD